MCEMNIMSSLFLLQERILDLFGAVDGRDDDEQGAAGDDQT
jgi:hypothetical protein